MTDEVIEAWFALDESTWVQLSSVVAVQAATYVNQTRVYLAGGQYVTVNLPLAEAVEKLRTAVEGAGDLR